MLLAISVQQGFAQDEKGLTIGYSANYLMGIKNKDLTSFKNGYNSALGNQLEQPFINLPFLLAIILPLPIG